MNQSNISDASTPPSAGDGRALVQVENLEKTFTARSGSGGSAKVTAVAGVSFDIRPGETLGLVGESGCGKTTLGRTLLRLEEPTGGTIRFRSEDVGGMRPRELRRLRRDAQMIYQDPFASLNPRMTAAQIIGEPLIVHRVGSRDERVRRVAEMLERVGLGRRAGRRYPHEFSGGQRQRLGIARALALNPALIIADEPVSALDVSIQAQVINLLQELQERFSLTYIVIAHDLAVVRHISTKVGVMYLGGIVEEAPSSALYSDPLHPYTKALMSAVPVPDPEVEVTRSRILLRGDLPSPADPPSGCRFHTRCPWKQDTRCADERPALRVLGDGHKVACHFAEDIKAGLIKPHEVEAQVVAPDEAAVPSYDTTEAHVAGGLAPGGTPGRD